MIVLALLACGLKVVWILKHSLVLILSRLLHCNNNHKKGNKEVSQ